MLSVRPEAIRLDFDVNARWLLVPDLSQEHGLGVDRSYAEPPWVRVEDPTQDVLSRGGGASARATAAISRAAGTRQ